MYKFLTKNGQTGALVLGVLCIIIFFATVYTGFNNSPYDMGTDLNEIEDKSTIGFFNTGLIVTGGLVFLCVLALIVFSFVNLVKFPKSAMKFGLGFIVLLAVFGGLYATSNMETSEKMVELHNEFDVSEKVSKMISGGLKTMMGLGALAFVVMIGAEVRNLFK